MKKLLISLSLAYLSINYAHSATFKNDITKTQDARDLKFMLWTNNKVIPSAIAVADPKENQSQTKDLTALLQKVLDYTKKHPSKGLSTRVLIAVGPEPVNGNTAVAFCGEVQINKEVNLSALNSSLVVKAYYGERTTGMGHKRPGVLCEITGH